MRTRLARVRARVERLAAGAAKPTHEAIQAQLILERDDGHFGVTESNGDLCGDATMDPLVIAYGQFKAVGLSFLELGSCGKDGLAAELARREAAAGGAEAFAQLLGHAPDWTWRR